MASGVSKNRSGERDDEMSLKKFAGFCGAVTAALFLCIPARADQNFMDFDDYLIAAPVMTAGSMAKGNGTVYQVTNPTTGVVSVSTPTIFYRADGSSYISVETIVSSDTIASQTFTDGQAATATLTVASYTGLSTATASGTFTAVSTSAAVGVQGSAAVVISSNVSGTQIAITGPPGALNLMVGGNVGQGYSSTSTAVNFATAVIASSNTSGMTASVNTSSTVVTVSCLAYGTFCNNYAVTSSSPTAISTAAFSGGTNPVTVTVGGAQFTAAVSSLTANQFNVGANTTAMATNLAAQIAASSNTIGITAASAGTVVSATATVAGAAGNSFATLTSNALAISTAALTMSGGQSNAVTCINGACLTANKDYYPATSNTVTAAAIVTAWSTQVASQTITLTSAGAIISATSTVVGTAPNSYLLTVTTNAITPLVLVSSSATTGAQVGTFSGGTNAAYTLVNGTGTVLTIPNHGFNTALPVLYSTGSATAITGLTNQTTYYPIYLTANTISLASSTVQAMLGNALPLTSSQTKTTADTFTLAPLAITGTPSWQFVVSDDAINWVPFTTTVNNIAISSATYSSYISTGTVNVYDLNHMDYAWFGAKVIPPTTGALNFGMKVIGKTQ